MFHKTLSFARDSGNIGGDKIGGTMTQTDLDDAYANGKYIAGADEFPPRWAAKAKDLRDRLAAQGRAKLDLAYGPHPRNRLDILLPDQPPKGLVVIVHGGYWLAFDKSSWSHLATGALARGYAVALPSYVLAPEARLDEITRQIAAAICFSAESIPGPIYLTGHSAGGHLVSRMICGDLDLPAGVTSRLAGVVSISGLHDLRPLLRTSMNDNLKLNAATAKAESAILAAHPLPVPITAWVGGNERPAFIDQSRWLAQAWPTASVVIEPAKHHFDVIDGLESPDSPLMRALLG